MKKWLFVGAGVLCVVVFMASIIVAHNKTTPKARMWNLYKGEIQGYNVEIDESRDGDGFIRLVHLFPKGSPSYVSITGHDYYDDGHWDRVFYCGLPESKNGCNSVLFPREGGSIWEPCNGDKDRVKPFTVGEMMAAKELLNKAMIVVHNAAHMTHSEDFQKKNSKQ